MHLEGRGGADARSPREIAQMHLACPGERARRVHLGLGLGLALALALGLGAGVRCWEVLGLGLGSGRGLGLGLRLGLGLGLCTVSAKGEPRSGSLCSPQPPRLTCSACDPPAAASSQ